MHDRSFPFEFQLDDINCEINDSSNTTCRDFILAAPSWKRCTANIKFNYTFTSFGVSCIDVKNVNVDLGPEGARSVCFDDICSFQERKLCYHETVTLPDYRSNVDLCEESVEAWEIVIEINGSNGRSANMTALYDWEIVPTSSAPTMSNAPSVPPIPQPSAVPSIDTCASCTFISMITASK